MLLVWGVDSHDSSITYNRVCNCLYANIMLLPKVRRFGISRCALFAEYGLHSCLLPLVWVLCDTYGFSAHGHSTETCPSPSCEAVRVTGLHARSLVLRLHWQISLRMWKFFHGEWILMEIWLFQGFIGEILWLFWLILHLPLIPTSQLSPFRLIFPAYKLVTIKQKKKTNLEKSTTPALTEGTDACVL